MGQINLIRTQFIPRVTVVSPANDDVQTVDFVGYFSVGDTVDIIEVDDHGNILSVIQDNAVVQSINRGASQLTLDQVVDTTGLTGTPQIRCQNIDDGQEAIDRLYRRRFTGDISFERIESIIAQELNAPIAGQTQYDVADANFFRAGDTVDIIADEGLIQSGVSIVSVSANADDVNNYATIVMGSLVDTSAYTNPKILATSITIQDAIERNKEDIELIDDPVENEYVGNGDGKYPSFYTDYLYIPGTMKVMIDGVRKRLGTAGTLATLTTTDTLITLTSLVLGLDGNNTSFEIIAGAGVNVTVSGNFNTGYLISVTDNGGAATSKDIVDAINADADARRLVLAQYTDDGTGVVATFAETDLAGGLDDGTGDYAEIEQYFENNIANTGYKIFSFHIRPNERNRMNDVPQDDEDIIVDYRRPNQNV